MTDAYPLRWPIARNRTGQYYRKNGAFKKDGHDITIREAMQRLQNELDRIGGKDFVLSANLVRNMDGSPRSGQPQPLDPGVALYFTLKKKPICMPCDTYGRVEQNIAAIAKHIEATRAIERYGVASIDEMFTGFEALPAPGQHSHRHWRDVLGVVPRDLTLTGKTEIIEALFRARAKEAHPDRGGTHDMMAELNAARDQALADVTTTP